MKNYAGVEGCDDAIRRELELAGITVKSMEILRKQGEVPTAIYGEVGPWWFQRAWYYWVAEGPGIPLDAAGELHAKYGNDVRVGGSCACPTPKEAFKGFGVGCYHVDTQEGLKALADTIKKVMAANE